MRDETALLCQELIYYYTRQIMLGQKAIYNDYEYDVVNEKLRAVKYLRYRARNPIIVPDVFEIIGDRCFSSCKNIQGISLGKNIRKLEYSPFGGCYKLFNLEFNEHLQDLGYFELSYNYISSLDFPDSLSHFENICLDSLPFLKQISFGENICLYDPFNFKNLKIRESEDNHIEKIYFNSHNLSLLNFNSSGLNCKVIINNEDFTNYLYIYNRITYVYKNGEHLLDVSYE